MCQPLAGVAVSIKFAEPPGCAGLHDTTTDEITLYDLAIEEAWPVINPLAP